MKQKKVRLDKKSEQRSISPSNIPSTQKANQDSSPSSSKTSKPKNEKKANLEQSPSSNDSLSLSFIKNMQLSAEKESDKKSILTKASMETASLPVLDPNDPVVKHVKEITSQVKEDHKNFLASLKDIL